MTAVAPPRPPDEQARTPPPTPPAPPPARPRTQPRYLAPAEVALFAVTIAAVLGFNRVFATSDFLLPLLAFAIVGHLLTWAGRRRGLSVPVVALLAIPVFALLASWAFFWNTTLPVIPTGSTWDATGRAFSQAWATFQNIVPPAPTETGFVLAAAIAVFFAIFLADWAAFRLWSALEAVVPGLTLFIFCSLFGAGEQRELATGVFAAAVLAFLLLHRTAQRETSAGWLTTDVDRGSDATVRVGGALAAIAVLAGVLVGPHLPSAQSPSVIPWKGDGRNPVRTVISPLVNIQDRLLNQSDSEMFTVEADKKSYWRLMSLDTFERDAWKSSGQYEAASGDLSEPAPAADGTDIHQTFHISGLSTAWAPAAYLPTHLESSSKELRIQKDSATLIVGQEDDNPNVTTDAMTYSVVSRVPTFDATKLDAVRLDGLSDEFRAKYTELPDDFSPSATATAQRVTQGATTPYAQAFALQQFFSGPGSPFKYSQQVPAGHGESAVDQFLKNQQGYCEQFAGTYAAMARSIGLPTRVAVGFTWGEEIDATHFRVTGRYAHAWPEVYLGADYGWVSFEPTPGRGAPSSAQWTQRGEEQAGPTGLTGAPGTTAANSTGTTIVPQSSDPGGRSNPDVFATGGPTTTAAPGTDPGDEARFGLGSTGQVVATGGLSVVVVALVLGAYVALVLAIRQSIRRHRRERALDASAAVLVSWQELLEHLTLFGIRQGRTETPDELARRAEPYLGPLAGDVHRLAATVDAASFAPEVLDPAEAERAAATVDAVEAHVRAHTTTVRQWQERLDPRTLVPQRT